MCRSEPQMPVASTRTTASSGAIGSGAGTSSIRTCLGAWKVTARISRYIHGPLSTHPCAQPALQRVPQLAVDDVEIHAARVEEVLIGDPAEGADHSHGKAPGVDVGAHLPRLDAARDPFGAQLLQVPVQ